jgi:hypothetical protein
MNPVQIRLMARRRAAGMIQPTDTTVVIILKLIDSLSPASKIRLADKLADEIADRIIECADQGAEFYAGVESVPAEMDVPIIREGLPIGYCYPMDAEALRGAGRP